MAKKKSSGGGAAVAEPPVEQSAPATTAPAYDDIGYEADLDVDLIHVSDLNPRKYFDPVELEQLGRSILQHGQLQNLTVRSIAGGQCYELIGGERRYRAAKLVQKPTLRCRVITCDDAMAIELRGIENYRRAQLNAVEEAIWFQQMIGTGKYNQTTLADHLNIDRSQVSNRLRLLKLPEEWQARIMDGRLPPTHARCLIPWADRPTVLAKLLDKLPGNPDDLPSVEEFDREITIIVNDLTKTMQEGVWDGRKFAVTEEQQKELDCVDVPLLYGNGKKPRAFNVELWNKLQAEAEATLKAVRQAEASGDDDDEDEDSPAKRYGSVSRLHDYDLNYAIGDHVRSVLSANLKTDGVALRAFFASLSDGNADLFFQWLAAQNNYECDDYADEEEYWKVGAFLSVKNFLGQVTDFLRQMLPPPVTPVENRFSRPQVLTLATALLVCEELKLNPMAKWVPDADLLSLCSDDQLRELFTDQMAPEKSVKKWGRERLIKEAVLNWPPGYLPILLTPRVMLSPAQADGSDDDKDDQDTDSEEE